MLQIFVAPSVPRVSVDVFSMMMELVLLIVGTIITGGGKQE